MQYLPASAKDLVSTCGLDMNVFDNEEPVHVFICHHVAGQCVAFVCQTYIDNIAYLRTLAVSPSCRRRGLGAWMLKGLLSSNPAVISEIRAFPKPEMVPWYKKQGFELITGREADDAISRDWYSSRWVGHAVIRYTVVKQQFSSPNTWKNVPCPI